MSLTKTSRLLVTGLLALSLQPVLSQDFSALKAEEDRLYDRIISGVASQQEITRFAEVDKLVKQHLREQRALYSAKMSALKSGLDQVESQIDTASSVLLGNSTNLPTPPQNPVTLPISAPSRTGNLEQNPANPPETLPIGTEEPKLIPETPTSSQGPSKLSGFVQSSTIFDQFNTLAESSIDPALQQAVKHFEGPASRFVAFNKDALEYAFHYRGFGPSSEAGDIITGEKIKVHSLASVLYAHDKVRDEHIFQYVQLRLQAAEAIGEGRTPNLGEQEKNSAILLDGLVKEVAAPAPLKWSIEDKRRRYNQLAFYAVDNDPEVKKIIDEIHKKYNKRSKIAMVSARTVLPALGVISLVPTIAAPIASAGACMFVMSTGGPEEVKLLKELYLDKRLTSRIQMLTEESHMLLESLQISSFTGNGTLYSCSELMIEQLAGEKAKELLK